MFSISVNAGVSAGRVFSFENKTVIEPVSQGSGPVHVFIPLAIENSQQRIISEQVRASFSGQVEDERLWQSLLARNAELSQWFGYYGYG